MREQIETKEETFVEVPKLAPINPHFAAAILGEMAVQKGSPYVPEFDEQPEN